MEKTVNPDRDFDFLSDKMSGKIGPLTSSPIKTVRDGESDVWTGDIPRNTQHKVRTMRKSLEHQLLSLAQSGDTAKLIQLLEEGAPFVVDMVSAARNGNIGNTLGMNYTCRDHHQDFIRK